MDLWKGYRESFCFPADPMQRAHILNIWVRAQVKCVSLYRFLSLPVIICYWVQAILIIIYCLRRSKHYLLLQIVAPTIRKSWYSWHKPGVFRDFLNTIYRVGELWEILEEGRKEKHGQCNCTCSEVAGDFLSVLKHATTSIFWKSWTLAMWKPGLLHVNCGRYTAWRYAICISTSGNSALRMKTNKWKKQQKHKQTQTHRTKPNQNTPQNAPEEISRCLYSKLVIYPELAVLSWEEIMFQAGIVLQSPLIHVYILTLINIEMLNKQF